MAADAMDPWRWTGWMRVVHACGVLGFCLGVITWGLARVLSVVSPAILAITMAGAVAVLSDDHIARRCDRLRRWVAVACAGASVILIIVLASRVSAAWVWLWLSGLVVTSPPAFDAARGWLCARSSSLRPPHTSPHGWTRHGWTPVRGGAGLCWGGDEDALMVRPEQFGIPGTERGPETVAAARPGERDDYTGQVGALSTIELCQLWRVTHWMIREPTGTTPYTPIESGFRGEWRTERILRLAQLRHAALDELERRRPDAVSQWLGSGHHHADGPARYL